ncbi:low-specificity L-threonine aldolase [Candidatus Berkiella aquae]|uniref:Low specificity L-threonine aldolase n=1 Tax=Candidatus Berkiella aquae TaxID=295108 RepID=A0A0Q9Z114_9GAMM|nr:low-specificity L-threonine aldolase [Candidatus Berkiella aquae]MCS5711880.1 low-specificity L-threonine aldolase [Candidatus Berkiella aquae]
MKIIDLRSDTVTKPSLGMKQAMWDAEVGDDIFNDDPTVKHLEAFVAEKLGKEAALFVPSGTQSNLIGIMMHCQRGDEYLVGQEAHTYKWEGGGAAVLGSIQPQPVHFENDGSLDLNKLVDYIKPLDDHHPRTKLLCLENTQAGKVLPLAYLAQAKVFCTEHHLLHHLDGARVFNASVKLGVDVIEIAKHFDSVSVCLSKGLGAPIGSVLVASKDQIKEARRWRKVLGGGMRQAGVIAAAGIYALENNIQRLQEDHDNAQLLAKLLSEIDEIKVEIQNLQTNILYINVPKQHSENLSSILKEQGILIPKGKRVRLVTHLDVHREDIFTVVNQIKKYLKESQLKMVT